MDPLWKLPSGEFAGWRSSNRLYNADGKNIGYFIDNTAYSLEGDYLGEIYLSELEPFWIGKKSGAFRARGAPKSGTSGIPHSRHPDRSGRPAVGWEDPDF